MTCERGVCNVFLKTCFQNPGTTSSAETTGKYYIPAANGSHECGHARIEPVFEMAYYFYNLLVYPKNA